MHGILQTPTERAFQKHICIFPKRCKSVISHTSNLTGLFISSSSTYLQNVHSEPTTWILIGIEEKYIH